MIADTAVLTGAHLITISADAVLHPRARINSTYGPVTIGEGCIVSEKASVGLLEAPAEDNNVNDSAPFKEVLLEKDVVVEPSAIVEGSKIGEGTTLEAGSKVCVDAVLGKVSPLPLSHSGLVFSADSHDRQSIARLLPSALCPQERRWKTSPSYMGTISEGGRGRGWSAIGKSRTTRRSRCLGS